MLTNEDIQRIVEAHHSQWPTRDEYIRSFEELRQSIKNLTFKINNIIKKQND